jgi:predicted nucleic acid-binding protein
MIHLDTNLLIAAVNAGDLHHGTARRLAARELLFATSAIAWMEFHAYPVSPCVSRSLRGILQGGVIPFEQEIAALAGELIRATRAKRRTRMDTMIAATAIHTGAELATVNPEDFMPFVPFGLKLSPLP